MFREGMNGPKTRSKQGSLHDANQGKKRGLQRSKVVLAFSGGTSSRALLDLLRQHFPTQDQIEVRNPKNRAPPMFESLDVVYVDESGLPGFGSDRSADIQRIVNQTGFPLTVVRLQDAFNATPTSPVTLSTNITEASLPTNVLATDASSTPLDQLRAMFSASLHTPTSLAALHTALLHSLLRTTAINLGAEILLLGSSATRLAVRTLSAMAEGGGYAMGEDVGVEYTLDLVRQGGNATQEDLLVARPLGRVLYKELVYYAHSQNLECLTMQKPSTAIEPKAAGISALVEAFVLGLEDNFPSTVSTIIRTAQKLGMRTEDARERGDASPASLCPLCGLPAQEGASDWRRAITIDSLEEARRVRAGLSSSKAGIEPESTQETSTLTSPASVVDNEHQPQRMEERSGPGYTGFELASLLCYSCLLVLQGTKRPTVKGLAGRKAVADEGPDARRQDQDRDSSTSIPIPSYVLEEAMKRRRGGHTGYAEDDHDRVRGVRVRSAEEVKAQMEQYLL